MTYKLLDVLKRKNKDGKEYNIAVVLYKDDYGYSLIETMVETKQVESLLSAIKNPAFDIGKYITVVYNRFAKAYQPKITYAL